MLVAYGDQFVEIVQPISRDNRRLCVAISDDGHLVVESHYTEESQRTV